MKRKYGFIPQVKDDRDFIFSRQAVTLPTSVDLSVGMTGVYDQGQLGSCTAFGTAGAIAYDLIKQKFPLFEPSELFIYYFTRFLEGTVKTDSGGQVRDAVKVVNKYGVCDSKYWQYVIANFTKKPNATAIANALLNESVKYEAVLQDEAHLLGALAAGFPLIFGFDVKSSFESAAVAKTGIYKPKKSEKSVGGHCVLDMGYQNNDMSLIRNSWGKAWGANGYFWMPTELVLDAKTSSDFWVIETIK